MDDLWTVLCLRSEARGMNNKDMATNSYGLEAPRTSYVYLLDGQYTPEPQYHVPLSFKKIDRLPSMIQSRLSCDALTTKSKPLL